MQKNYLCYKLALILLTALTMQSCSKDNGINNTSVIATPYSVYYGDSLGVLRHTNDGINKPNIDFPADGVPSLAILTVENNLMWIKKGVPVGTTTAHISTNEGVNFNPTYAPLNPLSFDQTIAIYARDQKRVYIASALGTHSGVMYNEDSGTPGPNHSYWKDDGDFNPLPPAITITSFTQLKNNTLVAFDWTSRRLFTRASLNVGWQEQTIKPGGHPLPSGGQFAIGHFGNTIVMVDRSGANGAWYSEAMGTDWYQYTGLPAGVPLMVAYAPFESRLLIGTAGLGVYEYQGGGSFANTSSGLTENTIVRGITAKENIYVNGASVQFIYIATSKGVFRSQGQEGRNWVLVEPGDWWAIY